MMVHLANRSYTIDARNYNDVFEVHEAARLVNNGCRGFLCAGDMLEDGVLFDEYNVMLHEAALVEARMKTLLDELESEGKYYE